MKRLLFLLPLSCEAFLSIGDRPSPITRISTVALYSSSFHKDQTDASKGESLERSLKEGYNYLMEEVGPSKNLDSEVNVSRVVGPKEVLVYDTTLRGNWSSPKNELIIFNHLAHYNWCTF